MTTGMTRRPIAIAVVAFMVCYLAGSITGTSTVSASSASSIVGPSITVAHPLQSLLESSDVHVLRFDLGIS